MNIFGVIITFHVNKSVSSIKHAGPTNRLDVQVSRIWTSPQMDYLLIATPSAFPRFLHVLQRTVGVIDGVPRNMNKNIHVFLERKKHFVSAKDHSFNFQNIKDKKMQSFLARFWEDVLIKEPTCLKFSTVTLR